MVDADLDLARRAGRDLGGWTLARPNVPFDGRRASPQPEPGAQQASPGDSRQHQRRRDTMRTANQGLGGRVLAMIERH
jgi:hypothetical protein